MTKSFKTMTNFMETKIVTPTLTNHEKTFY